MSAVVTFENTMYQFTNWHQFNKKNCTGTETSCMLQCACPVSIYSMKNAVSVVITAPFNSMQTLF